MILVHMCLREVAMKTKSLAVSQCQRFDQNEFSFRGQTAVSSSVQSLLEPLLQEKEDVVTGHRQLRRILAAGRVHVGAVGCSFDKNCGQLRRDVRGDSQSVPRIDGTVWKDDSGGANVVSAVVFISLSHGLGQLLRAHIIEVCTLRHVVLQRETRERLVW